MSSKRSKEIKDNQRRTIETKLVDTEARAKKKKLIR
jgi:hypothetical protein